MDAVWVGIFSAIFGAGGTGAFFAYLAKKEEVKGSVKVAEIENEVSALEELKKEKENFLEQERILKNLIASAFGQLDETKKLNEKLSETVSLLEKRVSKLEGEVSEAKKNEKDWEKKAMEYFEKIIVLEKNMPKYEG